MFSSVMSAAVLGMEAYPVQVEADICDGLPMFCMVGDLSPEVREAADRVRTALRNTGIPLPPKRVTVNLSPAYIRKMGTRFDLPIAVALLAALGIIPPEHTSGVLLAGEMGLNGRVRPVSGILQTVMLARDLGCSWCLVPEENALEGAAIPEVAVTGVGTLKELLGYMRDPRKGKARAQTGGGWEDLSGEYSVDFCEVNAQEGAKRAAEIAAAGMHNLLMVGSPGAGKTMIARRIPTILPPLTGEESLEVTRVYSACGLLNGGKGLIRVRPFRSPHHTISANALAGGGRRILPGEISLANRGVLFLDELPEFSRRALETLRQPLEEGVIQISRADGKYTFPARFQLVAAMNPCKCGYYPDRSRCRCLPGEIRRYLGRISGPLLDRMDLCTEVPRVDYQSLVTAGENESSRVIRGRVEAAWSMQRDRYRECGWQFNAHLPARAIREYCALGRQEERLMEAAFEKLELSVRAYHRVVKTARTIADLEGEKKIREHHLMEALGFRMLDRKLWDGE